MLKKTQQKTDKEKAKKEKKKRDVGLFREYFELIAETLIYVFFVMTFLLQSFVIPTSSMEDNILVGDHILVDKVAYSKSLGFL
jgi:signal peptidase I